MAGSRVHKLGSIFERVTGLLESGAYKAYDKPIWYDVYQRHPPKYNPRFDRQAPDIEIKDIFYEEDIIRAKIHKVETTKYFDLNSEAKIAPTKNLIKSCQEIMKTQGVSVDEAIKIMGLSNNQDTEKNILR